MLTFICITFVLSIVTFLLYQLRNYLINKNILKIEDNIDSMSDVTGIIFEFLFIACVLSWFWIIYCIFC